VTTRQHALTVVAPVRADLRTTVATTLEGIERPVIAALCTMRTLHFGRFVLLSNAEGIEHSLLAFESNHDGDEETHLAELAAALSPFEAALFGAWEGYRVGELRGFVAKHRRPAATFYLGHPGLSVAQIKNDDSVRKKLEELLDTLDRKGEVAGRTATAVRDDLVRLVEKETLTIGPVDRGLPKQPIATIGMGFVVAATALLAVGIVPTALLVAEPREEAAEEPALVTEDDPRLDAIIGHEDAKFQNGLTHHVPLRPGAFRKNALRVVLWFLEQARKRVAYEGVLGGISSIHFARWVILDDDTVLFFSNYDGSWEAYLGDFVDKAHHYLTAVWTNTKWFPTTRGFVFDGAANEATFKRWTRTFQVKNQIWFSAYPHLTVDDVQKNVRLRAGAVGTMTEDEARRWLALL
jgi:hypothetical protein